jgi:hypothetical protein
MRFALANAGQGIRVNQTSTREGAPIATMAAPAVLACTVRGSSATCQSVSQSVSQLTAYLAWYEGGLLRMAYASSQLTCTLAV